MSDLRIYLGQSCGENTGDAATAATRTVISAPTLPDALTQANALHRSHSSWNSLHITVAASELGTAWSNPMDLASIPVHEAAAVTIAVSGYSSNGTSSDLSRIHAALLLAGLQSTSERKEADGTRVLTAQKMARTSQPASAKAIALPKRKAAAPSTNSATSAVTISLDDDEDDADVIDEDDLLQDEGDLAPDMNGVLAASKIADDCGGRTACDDCTCGRAEQEQLAGATAAPVLPIQTSACGKCGLGDAFRCASCPYLGKPAFKAGEEHLVLDLHDDF